MIKDVEWICPTSKNKITFYLFLLGLGKWCHGIFSLLNTHVRIVMDFYGRPRYRSIVAG
jgi:hypothetical protein